MRFGSRVFFDDDFRAGNFTRRARKTIAATRNVFDQGFARAEFFQRLPQKVNVPPKFCGEKLSMLTAR